MGVNCVFSTLPLPFYTLKQLKIVENQANTGTKSTFEEYIFIEKIFYIASNSVKFINNYAKINPRDISGLCRATAPKNSCIVFRTGVFLCSLVSTLIKI